MLNLQLMSTDSFILWGKATIYVIDLLMGELASYGITHSFGSFFIVWYRQRNRASKY